MALPYDKASHSSPGASCKANVIVPPRTRIGSCTSLYEGGWICTECRSVKDLGSPARGYPSLSLSVTFPPEFAVVCRLSYGQGPDP